MTRDSKSRFMETSIPPGPSSDSSLHPMVDILPIPSDTAVPGSTPSGHVPELLSNPKFTLFQQLVLSTKKSDAMKKHLNAYCQQCRIDPDVI